MLYIAFIFLVSTLVLGVMSIGAAATGSFTELSNLFYVSAGLFFLLLVTETVVRSYKDRKAREEFARKLEEATRRS